MTITVVASALSATRKHVSATVHGRVPVTPEMAVKLSATFATEDEFWVNLQKENGNI